MRNACVIALAIAMMGLVANISLVPDEGFLAWDAGSLQVHETCRADDSPRRFTAVLQPSDQHIERMYQCGETTLTVDISRFHQQAPEREAVSLRNAVIENRWVYRFGERTVTNSAGQIFRERSRELPGGEIAVAWITYFVGETQTPVAANAKLLEAWNAIRLDPQETAIVAVTVSDQLGLDAQGEREELLDAATERVANWYRSQYKDS